MGLCSRFFEQAMGKITRFQKELHSLAMDVALRGNERLQQFFNRQVCCNLASHFS